MRFGSTPPEPDDVAQERRRVTALLYN